MNARFCSAKPQPLGRAFPKGESVGDLAEDKPEALHARNEVLPRHSLCGITPSAAVWMISPA